MPKSETDRTSSAPDSETERAWRSFRDREKELVPFTVRIPETLQYELRKKIYRSTMQLLTEHAYECFMGSRVPPRFLGPEKWPTPSLPASILEISEGRLRSLTVRLPRDLLRRVQTWAIEAELTDQELALQVFQWYLALDLDPPYKFGVRRDSTGGLEVDEKLPTKKLPQVSMGLFMEYAEVFWTRQELAKGGWTWPQEKQELKSPSYLPVLDADREHAVWRHERPARRSARPGRKSRQTKGRRRGK